MKTNRLSLMIMLTGLVLTGCKESAEAPSAPPVALDTDEQKVSYIMGMNIGSQISSDDFELDMDTFTLGISDAFSGAEPRLSEEEVRTTIESFQADMAAKQEAEIKKLAEANQKEGEAFLAEKAAAEGVVVLESGLQYKVLEAGTGPKPSPENTVEVHYRGTLIDGTEFDSSYKRGVPAQFGVTQVIPGWTEALQLMPEGSRWELYIPSDLAYGPGGTGGAIGPNQTLVFEVELLQASVSSEADEAGGDDGE